MKNLQSALLVALASTAISGCATVINGTSQDYKIRTDPKGATVSLNNGTACVTPCETNLKRRRDLRADIKLDGYKPVYVLVQSRTGGTVAGNLLLGGLIGGVVDSSNGSSNHLYPNPLNVKMAPVGSSSEAMLLDKHGKEISTVAAYNEKVRADVAETIGVAAASKQADSEPATGTPSTAVVAPPLAIEPAATPTAVPPQTPAAEAPPAAVIEPVPTATPAPVSGH